MTIPSITILFHFTRVILLTFSVLGIAGCTTSVPSIAISLSEGRPISDESVVLYVDKLKQRWGIQAIKVRALDVGGSIALSTLSAASAGVALGGGSAGAVAIVVNAMAWVAQVFGIVDPLSRVAAYNEGSRILLNAEGRYVETLTKSGYQIVPKDRLTVPGATLLRRANLAIVAVDRLLLGSLPTDTEMRELLSQ